MKVRNILLITMLMIGISSTSSLAKSLDQRAATWQKATMMHYKQQVARANGSPSPTWPHSHCGVRCHQLIVRYSHERQHAEAAWNAIRHGTDRAAVRKIIRFWFRSATPTAYAVASCENSFVANNGPSPTGDWGVWQINYSAHSRAFGPDDASFFRVVNDPWESTQVAYRWSDHGTNFSPTWVCATIHGIA